MVLAILLLIDEHERLDAEINARTYGLSGTSFFLSCGCGYGCGCGCGFLVVSCFLVFSLLFVFLTPFLFVFFFFFSDPECKLNPAISLTKVMSKILWIGEKPV